MASLKFLVAFLALALDMVSANPLPGGWGHSHEHHVIHVPYHVHTVHHHHVKKVHVPVPVVKKIIVHEEPHAHLHDIHDIHHGGWW